jgi:hypothetical protein
LRDPKLPNGIIGIRLVVAPILQVGRVGIERHQSLQGPVVHR